jgi:hypothetical protein
MRSILLVAMLVPATAGVLDRIAVTVGKQVITEGDVLSDLRVAAFLDQKPVDASSDQKRKAADRLVDQFLILQEANFSRLNLIAPEDGPRMLEQVRAQFPNEAQYRAALERYKITEAELSERLLNGLRAMRFTDIRFRPEIQLSSDELHEFYESLRQQDHDGMPSFEDSRERIEKLLTDQRVAQALDRWLGAQRTETQILYRDQVFK